MACRPAVKIVLLALASVGLVVGCRRSESGRAARAAGALPARATPAGTPGREIPLSVLWWNRPRLVKRFDLSEKQRASMDDARTHFTAQQMKASQEEQAAREALAQSLWSGDWADARRKASAVADLAAARERLRVELMVGVLTALTEEQRRRLSMEMPRILSAPWSTMAVVQRPPARRVDPASDEAAVGDAPVAAP